MWRSTVGCIVILTLSILAMALAATAQPVEKVHRIGRLNAGIPPAGPDPLLEAFRQGLRDLGYVEGRNILIESRYAEGQEDRFPTLAAELVHLPVDVLVAAGATAIQAAQVVGVQLHVLEARNPDELQRVFAALPREGVHALFILTDALLLNTSRADVLATLALQSRVPAMYGWRIFADAGGLMSYGPSSPGIQYRAAYYVDRLLQGTPPAELPVEQPRKFELVLNLKTAQALGLTIPPHLLVLADEVLK